MPRVFIFPGSGRLRAPHTVLASLSVPVGNYPSPLGSPSETQPKRSCTWDARVGATLKGGCESAALGELTGQTWAEEEVIRACEFHGTYLENPRMTGTGSRCHGC